MYQPPRLVDLEETPLLRELANRLRLQRDMAWAFVPCPACSDGDCSWCGGTRKVTRPTVGQFREMVPRKERQAA